MEKIILKDCWENKYIDHKQDIVSKSLEGDTTFYHDKWGALIISKDTFGNGDRLYECELEYIDAIKHLLTIEKYEKLLNNRDTTNEENYDDEFNIEDALIEEVERRIKYE